MTRKHPLLYRVTVMGLFVLYLAGVAYLCFSSGESDLKLPETLFGLPFDKCVHFGMFLPFTILGTLAFYFRSWWRSLSVTTLLAIIIAFSFEKLQSVITEFRVTDPADLNANILGIASGLFLMVAFGLITKKK